MGDIAGTGRAVVPHGRQSFAQAGQNGGSCTPVTLIQGEQVLTWEVFDDRDIGRVVRVIAVQQVDPRNPDTQGRELAVRGLEQVGTVRTGELVSAVADAWPVGQKSLRFFPQICDCRCAIVEGKAVDTFLRATRQPGDGV